MILWNRHYPYLEKRIYYSLKESASLITNKPVASNWSAFNPITLNDIYSAIVGSSSVPAIISEEIVQELWNNYLWPRYSDRVITYVDMELNEDDDSSNDQSVWMEPFNIWWGNFNNILISSYGRYAPLINIYKEKEATLLSEITSTTTVTNEGTYSNEGNSTLESNSNASGINNTSSNTANNFNDVPTNYGNYNSSDYNTTINGSNVESKTTSSNTDTTNNTNTSSNSGTNNSTQTTNVDNTNLIPVEERLKNIREKWENLFIGWADEFIKLFNLSA